MREPATGAIRLDERDLRDLDADQLRREIAVVSPVEVVRVCTDALRVRFAEDAVATHQR